MKRNEKIFVILLIGSLLLNGLFIGLYINSGINYRNLVQERNDLRIRNNKNNTLITEQVKIIENQRKSIDRIKNKQDAIERGNKIFDLNESRINDIDNQITEGIENLTKPNQENLEILRQIIESANHE